MERVLATYTFGPHNVVVLEHVEDEGLSYSVLVDRRAVTEPVDTPLSFEDVVRLYARAVDERDGRDEARGSDGRTARRLHREGDRDAGQQ